MELTCVGIRFQKVSLTNPWYKMLSFRVHNTVATNNLNIILYRLISSREVTFNNEGYCNYKSLFWLNRNAKFGEICIYIKRRRYCQQSLALTIHQEQQLKGANKIITAVAAAAAMKKQHTRYYMSMDTSYKYWSIKYQYWKCCLLHLYCSVHFNIDSIISLDHHHY